MASSTMTTMTTLLFSIILFSHTLAYGDIIIGPSTYCHRPAVLRSTQTGRVVEAKPEWKVEISNPCVCGNIYYKLTTEPPNFKPAVPIDPSILRKENSGNNWIVNNGHPLLEQETFNFTYVGDAVKFKVIRLEGRVLDQSSKVICPL